MLLFSASTALTLFPAATLSQEPEVAEKVKAAYLYNFAKFVEWPTRSFADTAAPFRICVVGANPLAKRLGEIDGRLLKDRSIKIENLSDDALEESKAKSCQILYFTAKHESGVTALANALQAAGVLTVTESPGEATITFNVRENSLKFDVDLIRSKQAGLEISARLLTVANQVKQ